MFVLLILAVAIWVVAGRTARPAQARMIGFAGLWGLIVLLHLILPPSIGFRQATGGTAEPWLILGGIVALIWAYRAGLGWLRSRAEAQEAELEAAQEPAQTGPFRDAELTRYARHIILREIGGPGQKKLKDAKVLVIGAGGLGSPALMYLAAAGVGTIGVVDDDEVDASNLQRQVIHGDSDIGRPKVHSAADQMRDINPFVDIRTYQRRLGAEDAADLLTEYDLVLDGTDNFTTRYLANAAAVEQGKPLISGALSQWEGQVSVFHPSKGGPCYQCVFPEAPAPGLAPSCAEAGVIGPLPGVVGSMMAVEAVKQITGAGAVMRGQMLIYDALWGETRSIRVKARADCPVCHGAGLEEGGAKA